MATATRSPRRATLKDLMIAYLIILVLAIIAYIYFSTYTPFMQTFNVHISQNSYDNGLGLNLIGMENKAQKWGDDDSISFYNFNNGFGLALPVQARTVPSYEDRALLPVESYLGDTERPARCDGCFNLNIKHVIENDVCRRQNFELLILIASSSENFDKRRAIRETWLSSYSNNTGNVRHLFLLGLNEMTENDEKVKQENSLHRDILQGDFLEDYHNLTYKTLMGLNWSVASCIGANLVAKVDDDVWLNVETALDLAAFKPFPFHLGGRCQFISVPVRNPGDKWYASYQSFPNDKYPPFCAGPGYVTTIKTAAKILEISKNIPYFHLEDVYIGLCLERLKLKVKTLHGFMTNQPFGHTCQMKQQGVVLVHHILPENMRVIHNTHCRNKNVKIIPATGNMRARRPNMW